MLHRAYCLFQQTDDFLFGVLVPGGGAWVCCDDFLDSGCEISSHTSVRLWFVGNVLVHVFQEEGPFLDPAFPLRRWGVLPPYWSIERSCAVGGRYPPPEEDHRDHSENPAVAWIVCVVAIVQADLR